MKLSIFAKQLGSAGLLLALLIVVGVVAISGLASVSGKASDSYEKSTKPLGELAAAAVALNENRAFTNQHVLERDPKARADIETAMKANSAVTEKALAAVKPTLISDEAKTGFSELVDLRKRYAVERTKVLDLSNAGDTTAAYHQNVTNAIPLAKQVKQRFELLLNSKVARGATTAAEVHSTFTSKRTLMIVLIVAGLVTGFSVAFLIARAIVNGVRQMRVAADGIAVGDLDQRMDVRSRDELGETAASFERMIEYMREMAAAADRVAQGDLTVTVEPKSERDALGNSFAEMVANLRGIVGKVSSAASSLSASSEEMASTSTEAGKAVGEIASAVSDVAAGAERQVRVVESARRTGEEVAAAIVDSATNAQETARAVEETRSIADEGVAAAQSATEAMRAVRESSQEATGKIRELAAKSDQIGGIVQTITGIAEQTNLLALNAAIEAARAGEQGRGFAVVAEEVRKLAEESQTAAGSISGLIEQIQGETQGAVSAVEDSARRTEDGAATVDQTRDAFERIGASVDGMGARIEQIAVAAQQIAANAERMQSEIGEVAGVAESASASAEEVSASTEQTSASTQEIAASAQELASTAEELERLVGEFSLV
jgi:methyl-accepting chemotaxis protein